MIALDANLLVYAYSKSMPEHETARSWLDAQLGNGIQIAVPWESCMAFVRLVANDRIFSHPATIGEAWNQIERLLAQANVWVPTPTPQHADLVGELINAGTFTAKDVPNIHLAALAISHGLRLASHDQGFSRFEGLRWIDPLAA